MSDSIGLYQPVRTPSDFKAIRIEELEGVTYFGYADIGSVESAAVWQIKRLTETNGLTKLEWAEGNAEFDNVWDNRASLTYL